MGRSEEPNMRLPILGSKKVRIVPSGLYNIIDDSRGKMGPREDEGNYGGYEEQGNWQLKSVQSFLLITNIITELCQRSGKLK
jgi:hypothetical protein